MKKLMMMLAIMLASVTVHAGETSVFMKHCYTQKAPENPMVATDCAMSLARISVSGGVPVDLIWMQVSLWNPYHPDDPRYADWDTFTTAMVVNEMRQE